MCNRDELLARKSSIKRVREQLDNLVAETDHHARMLIAADLKSMLDGLDRVINLKLDNNISD